MDITCFECINHVICYSFYLLHRTTDRDNWYYLILSIENKLSYQTLIWLQGWITLSNITDIRHYKHCNVTFDVRLLRVEYHDWYNRRRINSSIYLISGNVLRRKIAEIFLLLYLSEVRQIVKSDLFSVPGCLYLQKTFKPSFHLYLRSPGRPQISVKHQRLYWLIHILLTTSHKYAIYHLSSSRS